MPISCKTFSEARWRVSSWSAETISMGGNGPGDGAARRLLEAAARCGAIVVGAAATLARAGLFSGWQFGHGRGVLPSYLQRRR